MYIKQIMFILNKSSNLRRLYARPNLNMQYCLFKLSSHLVCLCLIVFFHTSRYVYSIYFRHIRGTKLNCLLCNISLNNRCFWSIWILHIPFEYFHASLNGPHILISLTRWTIKWTMIWKNEGGKYISSWHKIMIVSFSNSSNLVGSITFLQIALKNRQRRVMTCLTLFGRIPRIATGRRSCIRTWQLWDFKPISFKSFIETGLLIFEEYPCDTFNSLQTPTETDLFRVWHAGGKYVRLPWGWGCNSNQTPILTRSLRALIPSFVFPLICSNIPIILSQTFFFHMHYIYTMSNI